MKAEHDEFEVLKKENIILAGQIDSFGISGDEKNKLKRKLYNNKIKMLDLLEIKKQSENKTARQLRDDVDNRKAAIRYETGLHYLDPHLKGGFEVGSLIILGGQSGAGKSHILLDMLSNVSRYSKCLFFNFEMGDRRITKRLKRLLHTDEQWDNLHINSTSRDLDDLVMEIKLAAEDGFVFFSVDSKMKINVKGAEAEHQKISKISRVLSEVAIEYDIIIFLINQISEENLKTGRLAFKGSGDQLYDADMALFLTIGEEDRRTLTCAKNRQDEFLFSEDLPMITDPKITHENIRDYGTAETHTYMPAV